MAKILVSVRSAVEAGAAWAGGAAIIDVKEPRRGPLGRADDAVIRDVVRFAAGRVPVSAACGELLDGEPSADGLGLAFVKWGLARCGRLENWPTMLKRCRSGTSQVVHVAYADWQCAEAPPVDDVVALACQTPGSVLLLDTCCKEPDTLRRRHRPTLLDWMSLPSVMELCVRCRAAQIRIALAGSLGPPEIKELLPAQPDWFAVRGAACTGGDRDGLIDEMSVRRLVQLVSR